jgi:hypothetical protein
MFLIIRMLSENEIADYALMQIYDRKILRLSNLQN